MRLHKLLTASKKTNNKYFNEKFLTIFDMFVPLILKEKRYNVYETRALDSFINEGDFSGLLNQYGVDLTLHPIVSRLNNILNNGDLTPDINSFKVPSIDYITRLINILKTKD